MLIRDKRSAIVSMSSLLGGTAYTTTDLSVYASTKAFNDTLSRSIALEHPDKMDVISFKPSLVKTKMIGFFKESFYVITPEDCVQAFMKGMGKETEMYGHWKHELQFWIHSTYLGKKEVDSVMDKMKELLKDRVKRRNTLLAKKKKY